MNRIDPETASGTLDRLDIEIDYHRLLAAAHDHARQRRVGRGVDLLMRHEGRNKDEIARPGFGDVFEMFAPAHPRAPGDDVDDAFKFAVMMRAGLRVRFDPDRARPDFLRSGASVVDRRRARHPGRLCRIGVKLVAGNYSDAVVAPMIG